ncbi:MAG: LytTR family DNA-binding domain-containing protein [Blastocatellia bacterium]|nr:LytTR family DNA-binding domain-containing protein [Blastocatellia bacterium]
MTAIRAMIIDNEPATRAGIRLLLKADPEIEVVGECATGYGAVKAMQENLPDLLFLDVNMPGMDGFSALEAIAGEAHPHVIFVTASEAYAVRAFEVSALDYILKPFDRERFERALRRAKRFIQQERAEKLEERLLALLGDLNAETNYLQRVVVKNDGRILFIKTDDIDWVESEGNYVRIHVGKESHLLRETLGRFESQLNPRKFTRIHRQTIVNIDRVQELQALFHGDYRVILSSGAEVTMSRSFRREQLGV